MQDSTRDTASDERAARRNFIAFCAVSTVVMAALVTVAISLL